MRSGIEGQRIQFRRLVLADRVDPIWKRAPQLTKISELFFHTDRSGWDSPPDLLITMLKVKSETGGETMLVDGQQVIDYIKAHNEDLYDLVTDSKYSSFRADDGSFHPRPMYSQSSNYAFALTTAFSSQPRSSTGLLSFN